jgi:hypothetical protein
MWVRRAAIRPIPGYARVPSEVLDRVELTLMGDDTETERQLETAFARFESTQPALSRRFAAALGKPITETTLALGYFLSLAVWLAFDQTFEGRLNEVSDQDLESTFQSVALDEEIRENAPDEIIETDDVVAMEQPEVVEFIREHIDVALENDEDAEVDEIDNIYRMVLVEVVALSYAVGPPDRFPVSRVEWTA